MVRFPFRKLYNVAEGRKTRSLQNIDFSYEKSMVLSLDQCFRAEFSREGARAARSPQRGSLSSELKCGRAGRARLGGAIFRRNAKIPDAPCKDLAFPSKKSPARVRMTRSKRCPKRSEQGKPCSDLFGRRFVLRGLEIIVFSYEKSMYFNDSHSTADVANFV